MARISVVVPTFNRAATLARAIESVLAQTHGEVELVVVDDGSSDDTPAVLARYAGRLVAIRVEANAGANAARNRGIAAASGEIVCFLDSDDEFRPHKLAFVDAWFASRPEVDALVDSFDVVYPPGSGRPMSPRRNPNLHDSAQVRLAVFGRRRFRKPTPAISARRRALVEIGGFDATLRRRQDMDLILRLTRAHRCASIDEPLWIKHWTTDSITGGAGTFLEATADICSRHPDYLAEPLYRRGLERDVGRHFWQLAAAGRFIALRDELRRYARLGRFAGPPVSLVLQYLGRKFARHGQRLVAPRRGGPQLTEAQAAPVRAAEG